MKIEKNIPIPPRGHQKNTALLEKMEVGDSVLVENRRKSVSTAQVLNRKGWKAVTRTVHGGIRVWRTQ
jgi:hypothetical protein